MSLQYLGTQEGREDLRLLCHGCVADQIYGYKSETQLFSPSYVSLGSLGEIYLPQVVGKLS